MTYFIGRDGGVLMNIGQDREFTLSNKGEMDGLSSIGVVKRASLTIDETREYLN